VPPVWLASMVDRWCHGIVLLLQYMSSQFAEPLAYPAVDLISDFPEFWPAFPLQSLKGHGIFKGPEQALLRDAGEGGGTGLFGSITYDDE